MATGSYLNLNYSRSQRRTIKTNRRSKVVELLKKNEIRESSFEKKVEGRGRHPSSNSSRERSVGVRYKSHIRKARVEEIRKKYSFRSAAPRERCRGSGKNVFNRFPGPTPREPRGPSKNALQIRKALVETSCRFGKCRQGRVRGGRRRILGQGLKSATVHRPHFGARQDGRVASPVKGHTVRDGTRIEPTVCLKRSTRWKIGRKESAKKTEDSRGLNSSSSDKMERHDMDRNTEDGLNTTGEIVQEETLPSSRKGTQTAASSRKNLNRSGHHPRRR
ncbi:hypothetical protein TNCV_1144721 [Trichonephila clavipes]|nr:hypothetical protein TNCV_1144721 [Trichonephila clavipes]